MTEDSPTYSILIVNYNSWELLDTCVAALASQTRRDFRTLIFDNASDEPAPATIERRSGTRIVYSQANLGFAAACNRLVNMSKTDWVVLLNPDTEPCEDWFEKLAAASEQSENTFFSSRLLSTDGRTLDGDGDCYHISGLVWRRNHGKEPVQTSEPFEVFSASGAAAMYRRSSVISVGGFDEDFFCYIEDVDMGFRLRLKGESCLLIPSAVVKHVGSATSGGSRSDFSTYHGHRNLVWCYIKNMPLVLLLPTLPLHILVNLVALGVLLVRGQGAVGWRAKRDALRQIPRFWRKRRDSLGGRTARVTNLASKMTYSLGR